MLCTITRAAHSGKHNVTVWRLSICLSVNLTVLSAYSLLLTHATHRRTFGSDNKKDWRTCTLYHPYCRAEMYTGRVACCPLVSHSQYADGTDTQMDGRQTVILRFLIDAASVINRNAPSMWKNPQVSQMKRSWMSEYKEHVLTGRGDCAAVPRQGGSTLSSARPCAGPSSRKCRRGRYRTSPRPCQTLVDCLHQSIISHDLAARWVAMIVAARWPPLMSGFLTLIHWVKVLRPTRHKIGYVGDVLPSQSHAKYQKTKKHNKANSKHAFRNNIYYNIKWTPKN